jgi:alpha-glucosidase
MSVASCSTSKSYQIASPDGKISVTVGTDRHLYYNVTYNGENVIENSQIALVLEGGDTLGNYSSVRSARSGKVQENIIAPFHRQAVFDVLYNKLTLKFAGDYAVEFRVYNEGCAYRFITMQKGQMTVLDEIAEFRFAAKDTCWAAITQNVANAFQSLHVTTVRLSVKMTGFDSCCVALSSGPRSW